MDLIPIEKAIINSLAYRAVFDFAPDKTEIYNFLFTSQQISKADFEKAVNNLLNNNIIQKVQTNYYCLTQFKDRVSNRKQRNTEFTKKFKLAKNVAKYLKSFPFIGLIAVTGAVAAKNPDKNADIDIIVVSSANRLWITRFFVVLLLKIKGIYFSQNNYANKICPNIFLSRNSLEWPQKNIYTAHEVLLMIPMLNRNKMYEKFITQNNWAFGFLGNHELSKGIVDDSTPTRSGFKVLTVIDDIFYKAQLFYMKNKITTEILEKNKAVFHKNDNSGRILREYKKNKESSSS